LTDTTILIAGKDRSDEFLSATRQRLEQMRRDPSLQPRPGSLDVGLLGDLSGPDVLDRAFLELLRHRSQIDTRPFQFPRKPGMLGTLMFQVRKILWKLLRYQHDRMSSRQNQVNAWMINAHEYQVAALNDKVEELRKQIERQGSHLPKDDNPGKAH